MIHSKAKAHTGTLNLLNVLSTLAAIAIIHIRHTYQINCSIYDTTMNYMNINYKTVSNTWSLNEMTETDMLDDDNI